MLILRFYSFILLLFFLELGVSLLAAYYKPLFALTPSHCAVSFIQTNFLRQKNQWEDLQLFSKCSVNYKKKLKKIVLDERKVESRKREERGFYLLMGWMLLLTGFVGLMGAGRKE